MIKGKRQYTPVGQLCMSNEEVKRLCLESGRYWLRPENPAFSAIPVHAEAGIEIWGVVTAVVRPLERGRKSRVR